MSDVEWLAMMLGFCCLIAVGWRWYRKRRAAKAADKLLVEVLKGKDAFRR